MQENIMAVNVADAQTIDVYWQDEVVFDLDVQLMWVKSGQQEISKYVSEVSLPKIEEFAAQKMTDYVVRAENAAVSAEDAMIEAQKQAKNTALNREMAENSAAAASESVNMVTAEAQQALQEMSNYADTVKTEINTSAENAKTSVTNTADKAAAEAGKNINDYVEQTVKPEMQSYADKAENAASSAAASAASAKESAAAAADSMQNKADTDAADFSAAGKSLLSGLSLPGGKLVDLTFSHGQNYTAPANGYFALQGYMSNPTFSSVIGLYNETGKFGMSVQTPGAEVSKRDVFIPVSRGDVVQAYGYKATVTYLKFIYARGEV